MENAYGIGVKNRYALFYNEEEDPLEILKVQETEREKKKEHKQQHEKENKGKPGTAPVPAPKGKVVPQTTTAVKKGPAKETLQVKQQEQTTKKEGVENNKSRSQKPPADRNVKFTSPREAPHDLEERKNRRNRDERELPAQNEFRERDREPRQDSGEPRRGGRGGGRGSGPRGGGRGGRGGGRGGFDNRGKREFDRQSGSDKSGVKPVDKRDGAGSHNWGTIKDDMEEQLNAKTWNPAEESQDWSERNEELPAEPAGGEPTPKPDEQAGGEQPDDAKPVEEEPKQMTLDEWKKEQEKKRSAPKFNLRKPGEGEDNSQWKKTYVLKKKAEEEESEEEGLEEEEESVRRGRQKHLVDIEINFSDSRRGRGRGRGGRGGMERGGGVGGMDRDRERGNGGGPGGNTEGGGGGGGGSGGSGGPGSNTGPFGGRGGPGLRGSRPARSERGSRGGSRMKSQSAPKVDDENDFPSLQTA